MVLSMPNIIIKLMSELEKGRISGEQEGWYNLKEVREELGIPLA
jgi:hypothetical protein